MPSESSVSRASGVTATILTAENGLEAFGRNQPPSPEMLAWVVAATLAKELEGRLTEEESAQLEIVRVRESARRDDLARSVPQNPALLEDQEPSTASPVGSLERAQEGVVSLSRWADSGLAGRGDEAILLHRVFKLMEESGEVATALIGVLGANPRKGVTHEMSAVKEELLDVALTALGAYDHIEGNEGSSVAALLDKIERVAQRAGVLDGES